LPQRLGAGKRLGVTAWVRCHLRSLSGSAAAFLSLNPPPEYPLQRVPSWRQRNPPAPRLALPRRRRLPTWPTPGPLGQETLSAQPIVPAASYARTIESAGQIASCRVAGPLPPSARSARRSSGGFAHWRHSAPAGAWESRTMGHLHTMKDILRISGLPVDSLSEEAKNAVGEEQQRPPRDGAGTASPLIVSPLCCRTLRYLALAGVRDSPGHWPEQDHESCSLKPVQHRVAAPHNPLQRMFCGQRGSLMA
jgi:hypothetical protein